MKNVNLLYQKSKGFILPAVFFCYLFFFIAFKNYDSTKKFWKTNKNVLKENKCNKHQLESDAILEKDGLKSIQDNIMAAFFLL